MMPMFRVALDSASACGCAGVVNSLRETFTLCHTTRRALHTHPTLMPVIALMRLMRKKRDGQARDAENDACHG
jgi:hypothetical protein